MSKTATTASAALPIAQTVLRILMIINWAMAALIIVMLFVIPNRDWIIRALDLSPSLHAERVIWGLRSVCVLGLVSVPINYLVLRRLLAIVQTVRDGDPFVAANALRLRSIAWALLVLQLLGMLIGMVGKSLSTPDHPVDLDAGFSVNGWLAVLLTFVLAQVFAEGARMRADLEGTV
jgi:hypothetical protein